MDFKSMKRRELQALCKKHGLPANSTNSQMTLSLASFLRNNEKIKLRGCLKGSDDESGRKNSSPKKVSFFLEDEEFEFEKSLGVPEKRRSTRRASVGAIKADDRKARVPEVPARITRSRTLEVFHLTASQEDEDVQCDGRKKRKESCVVEPNLRTLRNRVVIVPGNECELPGNQKLRRGPRRDAGEPKEIPRVDAFQNMKLGEGEAFEKKISRKRSRVADVGEALPCNNDYGYAIPESAEVGARADDKVPQCGEPPPRRSKRVLLTTETVVFDVGAAEKVEALPKRSTRSNVKSNVVESEISTAAEEKSGVESDIVGGNKQMKRTSNRAIKSKAPAVSKPASDFITESTATEACGQLEELPKFRVPSRRMTRSSSKQVARELVTLLPASEKLVNGKETARATSSRKKHGNRKSSETLCLSGETVSVSKALEVQVAQFEEVPLHPMQNTCEIGVKECEATDGLKQIDDVARGQDSMASPCVHAESEALAVLNKKVVARRATRNSTKNEALLTSTMQNPVPKEKVAARRLTHHSTKNEALLASVPQNVPVGVGKKGSTAKRAREAVPDEDATYVERDISGGFPVTRNQENGITVNGNDKKPGSHVTNTRGSKRCRRVNSIAEASQGKNSPDPPLSLLEDSRQDIFIGEGSACKVSSKRQPSQRLQSIGKLSLYEQKNSENIHKRSGDDKLVDGHKCMEEGCSTHEDQVMISGSSEVMDVCETLEASPCSAVQDNCAQNVDVENISEARNSAIVDPKHSSLSMHASGSFGLAETVTEAVGNPQMDTLLASEQSKKAFIACTECVENVKQVNVAEDSHEFIDSESTSIAVADQCEMVIDVIHNIHNEDDPKHKELSHAIVGVSLTCEEIQELTPAIGIETSLGVDQEKFAMVAGAPDAREISSHLTDNSNDTHVNNSEGSSDQQSIPLEDMGTVEETPAMTMLVFKSATETFGYVEEIKVADKNSINSCSGKLAFEESKETVVPDSENFSLLVALQEDSAEMKQSLLVDRLSAVQCAGVSQRETLKISSCFEISHDGSSSHNHMIAIRPEARMQENKETSASQYVVSLILDKGASEVLDGIDAKNHSEREGDCNVSLEENLCEATRIDVLPLTTGDLLEKHDEGIGMAAKDIEFLFFSEDMGFEMKVIEKEAVLEVFDGVDAKNHLEVEGDSNTCLEERFCKVSIDPLPPTADDLQEKRYENKDLACEMEVIFEKPGCLEPEEDGAASESHLQMDHETATLLKLDGMIIDSKSGIQKVILEVTGEDASETYDGESNDGCHEHGKQDDERAKISSIDVVLQQFIFSEAVSAETVSEDFQKADYEEHPSQPKMQGGDEMAWHFNSYSSVDSVDIHDPRTHDSSYLQTDVGNQIQAPSMFAREREAVSWYNSQTCETLPRDLKNSTAACFPVDMGNISGESEDSHNDDEASQVKNVLVTDNVGFQLCYGGLLQQDTHKEPAEDDLKDVLGSIDSDPYIKEPNLLIYNLAAGGVSEVGTSNANTTIVSEQNQISAFPCTFHEDRDCASPSLIDDLKSAEETENHAFNGQLMDADEAAKHDFPATSDDLNKENVENSEGDVVADEDGNENSRVPEENTLHEDVPFLLQRVCDNNNELHDAGIAAYSSDIYDSRSGLTPLQNATLPSQTKNESNMVKFCTAKEVTIDRIEEIEGKYDNNNREVQNFVKGSEPTISKVNAEDGTMGHRCGDVLEITEHSNREQDVTKNENMDMVVRYGTDDIEGTRVAKGQSESTSLFNIHDNFKDGENANGCQDVNFMSADMMVEKESNTDITKSVGTSAESLLCEAPSSSGQLISVSKVLLCDNWNKDFSLDVCEAVSGEHDDGKIYQIENQTCVSPQKGDALKHEVIFQAETSNLQGHDNSSERIDSVDFEETKGCGIRDYQHLKECSNLEGHEQIQKSFHETGCQVSCADTAAANIKLLTSTEQEPGEQSSLNDANQTNAGFAISPPATETRQTVDTEPPHPLAKETLITSAYSPQTNCFNSLDCQASGLFSDERRSFQDTTFAEDDNEKGLGDEMGAELCYGKLKDQNDAHKLNNETSIVVENTTNETKNNSNGIEMYRMEESTCISNQSSAFQEPVCAESVDPAEESMNQENQLVSSFDCSPSKFRNNANTDDSGIDLLDEINHKLRNFTISSANKFKKVQLHRTPMQLVDALRPQTRICELKNKENTSLVKIHHSIIQTVEKPRRPLQSLQNNERIQQQ